VVGGQDGEAASEVYEIPEEWRLIGTMNSLDKASLFQLSFAFMRRFAFVHIDVPDKGTYESIIENQTKRLEAVEGVSQSSLESFQTALEHRLKSLFATAPTQGLRGINLPIGPAIPIDMTSYIFEKITAAPEQVQDEGLALALVQAMEMYLFPQ